MARRLAPSVHADGSQVASRLDHRVNHPPTGVVLSREPRSVEPDALVSGTRCAGQWNQMRWSVEPDALIMPAFWMQQQHDEQHSERQVQHTPEALLIGEERSHLGDHVKPGSPNGQVVAPTAIVRYTV